MLLKKPTETISDWTIKMRHYGLDHSASKLETSRLEDDERVRNSGLPCFEKIDVPYHEFSKENKKLMEFFSKYQSFVIRALPPPQKNLPRRPKVGLKSFEECQAFLESLFSQGNELHGNEEFYTISLSEHELSTHAGIIISNLEKTIIEISEQGLAELSHGHVTDAVVGVFAYHDYNHFRSIRYSTRDTRKREFMWRVLQYIRKDQKTDGLTDSDIFPEIAFWTGYFELVGTETGRIVFWDYKVKEGYLNI